MRSVSKSFYFCNLNGKVEISFLNIAISLNILLFYELNFFLLITIFFYHSYIFINFQEISLEGKVTFCFLNRLFIFLVAILSYFMYFFIIIRCAFCEYELEVYECSVFDHALDCSI